MKRTCSNKCSLPYFTQNRTCVGSCSADYYVNSYGVCVPQSIILKPPELRLVFGVKSNKLILIIEFDQPMNILAAGNLNINFISPLKRLLMNETVEAKLVQTSETSMFMNIEY